MSGKRRAGPVRQLSLQQPSPHSRRPLRKQQSEELWGPAPDSAELRVTASSLPGGGAGRELAASRAGALRPRPVKLAWAERRQPSQELAPAAVEVVARRCTGQPRPANLPAIGSDKDRERGDSILYTRQQLAERLRRAWRERELRRPNLDIFLAHNSHSVEDDGPTPRTRPSSSLSAPTAAGPLSPTIQRNSYRNHEHQDPQPSATSSASPTIQRNSIRNLTASHLHNELQPSVFGSLSPTTQRSNVRNFPSNQLHTESPVIGSVSPTTQRSFAKNISANHSYNEAQPAPISVIPKSGLRSIPSTQERNEAQTLSTSITTTTIPYFRSPFPVANANSFTTTASTTSSTITVSTSGITFPSKSDPVSPTVAKHFVPNQAITSWPTSAGIHIEGNATENSSTLSNKIVLNPSHPENSTSIKDNIVVTPTITITNNDGQDNTENFFSNSSHTITTKDPAADLESCSLSSIKNKPPTLAVSVVEATSVSPSTVREAGPQDKKLGPTDGVSNIGNKKKQNANVESDSVTTAKIVVSVPPAIGPEDTSFNDDTKSERGLTENKRQIKSDIADGGSKPNPLPAAARRVNFRNTGNRSGIGSFSGEPADSNAAPRGRPTPPLSRALSAPAQRPSDTLTKGILVKNVSNGRMTPLSEPVHVSECEEDSTGPKERNIKSAPARRRLKGGLGRRRARGRGEESSEEEADDGEAKEKEKNGAGRRGGRRVPHRGAEIVTMVSLMSPGASDNEDSFLRATVTEGEPQWFEDREVSPGPGPARPVQVAPPRIVCLRKSPKSVSFQQPTGYSANFPSRRGTAPLPAPEREKRPPAAPPADPTKRRLVRTKSAPPRDSGEDITPVAAAAPREASSAGGASTRPSTAAPFAVDHKSTVTVPEATQSDAPAPCPTKQDASAEPEAGSELKNEEPDFQTPKERECWQLYRRMCEKGVSVSYDTVLRGMLTPTEYRLRRNALLSTC